MKPGFLSWDRGPLMARVGFEFRRYRVFYSLIILCAPYFMVAFPVVQRTHWRCVRIVELWKADGLWDTRRSVAMREATAHPVNKMADLRLGDHLCCLYQPGRPYKEFMRSFLRQGFERGEKLLYIVDAPSPPSEALFFASDGRKTVEDPWDEPRIEISTARVTFLRTGVFDPEGMISLLQAKIEEALSEGFTGLRVCSEMSWVLRRHPGSEHMVTFESSLDAFLRKSACLFLCQYDQRRFGPALMLYTLANHPIAVVGGEIYENMYYMPSPDVLGKEGVPAATLHNWLGDIAIRKHAAIAWPAYN